MHHIDINSPLIYNPNQNFQNNNNITQLIENNQEFDISQNNIDQYRDSVNYQIKQIKPLYFQYTEEYIFAMTITNVFIFIFVQISIILIKNYFACQAIQQIYDKKLTDFTLLYSYMFYGQIFHLVTFIPVFFYFKEKLNEIQFFIRLLFFQQLFLASLYYTIQQFLLDETKTTFYVFKIITFFYLLGWANLYVSIELQNYNENYIFLHILWDLEFLQILFILGLYDITNSILVTPLYFTFYKDQQHTAAGAVIMFFVILVWDFFKDRTITRFIFSKQNLSVTVMMFSLCYFFIWRGFLNFVIYYDMGWLLENFYFKQNTNKVFDDVEIKSHIDLYKDMCQYNTILNIICLIVIKIYYKDFIKSKSMKSIINQIEFRNKVFLDVEKQNQYMKKEIELKEIVQDQDRQQEMSLSNIQQKNTAEDQCIICYCEKNEIYIKPCRHTGFCENCFIEILKQSKKQCPYCRTNIESAYCIEFDNESKQYFATRKIIAAQLRFNLKILQLMQTQVQGQIGEHLNLIFSCTKLKNKDSRSASDPQLFLYTIDQNKTEHLIGTSEIVKDTLDPQFQTFFKIFFNFERRTTLLIKIYDIDKSSKDFLAQVQFELGELVGHKNKKFQKQMFDQKNQSIQAVLTAEFEKAFKSVFHLEMQFKCLKIEDIEFFSKSDPFLRFYKHKNPQNVITNNVTYQDPEWILVHQTEFYKNNLNPQFQKFQIPDQKLCHSNPMHPIKIEVWDYSQKGKHKLIGSLILSLQDILQQKKEWSFMSKRKKGKTAGTLQIIHFKKIQRFDFIDYLQGGVFLNTMVGIDFTLSNIEPQKPSSLHYQGQSMNQYQAAIQSIVSIIQNYDIDKMIPVYGFGGQYNGQTHHCFPLTGNPQQEEVFQVNEVLQVYNQAIQKYPLSAPTNFSPMIEKAIEICRRTNNIMSYLILVIFTDGIITDLDRTIDKIVEASYFAISIIIVGVGNDSFSTMNRLDSDDKLLKDSKGKKAMRDIVQFVPFKKYNFNGEMLAMETLAEIPNQVESFYSMMKVIPQIKNSVRQFIQKYYQIYIQQKYVNSMH